MPFDVRSFHVLDSRVSVTHTTLQIEEQHPSFKVEMFQIPGG